MSEWEPESQGGATEGLDEDELGGDIEGDVGDDAEGELGGDADDLDGEEIGGAV